MLMLLQSMPHLRVYSVLVPYILIVVLGVAGGADGTSCQGGAHLVPALAISLHVIGCVMWILREGSRFITSSGRPVNSLVNRMATLTG